MQSRIKIFVVVILSVLAFAKQLNASLIFVIDKGCKLPITLPSLTNLSRYLNSRQHQLCIEDISLIAFLLLLLSWRLFFLTRQPQS
jgi:hypothetical protein